MKTKRKPTKIFQEIESKWRTLSKRDKTVLIIIVILLPLILYTKLYVLPEREKISQLEKEIEKANITIKNLKIKRNKIALLKKEKQKLDKIIKTTENYLPQKTEISDLLEEISKERERFNLEIIKFKIEKENITDFYAEIPIKVALKGNFANTMLFLDNIRKKERILNPSEINIKRKENSIISMCTINTYRTVNKEEIKKDKERKKK